MTPPELDDLPDEVIVRIFQFSQREDRRMLNLVNKRFNMIYKHRTPDIEFCYHLKGYTDKMFKKAFERLLTKDHIPFQVLRFSNFDLSQSFDKQFESDFILYGRTYEDFALNCKTCKNITDIEIFGCCLSDMTLIRLRRLFPNLSSLALSRCLFVTSGKDLIELDDEDMEDAPIKNLKLTLPFITPGNYKSERFFWWLISYCGYIDMLNVGIEKTGGKRYIARRFLKQYKIRNLEEYSLSPDMAEWLISMIRKTVLHDYNWDDPDRAKMIR